MKSQLLAALAALPFSVLAFPSVIREAAALASDSEIATKAKAAHEKRVNGLLVGFDPVAQYVNVSGAHVFVPPNFAAGDLRGPCPGLNALANHNFIPHNGLATVDQFVAATEKVFGMVKSSPSSNIQC